METWGRRPHEGWGRDGWDPSTRKGPPESRERQGNVPSQSLQSGRPLVTQQSCTSSLQNCERKQVTSLWFFVSAALVSPMPAEGDRKNFRWSYKPGTRQVRATDCQEKWLLASNLSLLTKALWLPRKKEERNFPVHVENPGGTDTNSGLQTQVCTGGVGKTTHMTQSIFCC